MRRLVGLWFMLAVSAALVLGQAKDNGEPYYDFVKGEVLVKFKTPAAVNELCAQLGGSVIEYRAELDYYRVGVTTGQEAAAVKSFRARGEVEWANFNYIARAFYTPDDTYYHFQWHYPAINMPAAWDVTRGSPEVVVAVVDMGFYFNHQDFANVTTVHPRDFVDNDNNPATTAEYSHGAHVAGTIFATTNNNLGVAGIAPLCTFMPVRALNDSGSGTAANIAAGIVWASDNGADVINLSLGYPVTGVPQDPGPPTSTAIQTAAAAGVVVCAAAGNDGAGYVGYPAAYTSCIAVGATGYDDNIAPYSNHGSELDVVAPGGNTDQDLNQDGQPDGVLSVSRDSNGDNYVWMQGTSMASPHVAGVAALLLSHGLTPAQVRPALQETALDLGAAGWDNLYGWGRINAQAALAWHQGGGGGTVLLNEGFEGGVPPQNWLTYEGGATSSNWSSLEGNTHASGGTEPHGGSNAAYHDDDLASPGDSVRDWLIFPAVDIPSTATSAQVSFYQRNAYVNAQYYGLHALLYSTDDSTYAIAQTFGTPQTTWAQETVNVISLQGRHVWFAFYYVGNNGSEWYVDDVTVTVSTPGAAGERTAVVKLLALDSPYPNPFNSVVQIPLELNQTSRVELSVYNELGQRVTTLLPSTALAAGSHRFTWNAAGVASGSYFVRLAAPDNVQTRKVLLIK
ncbi:MAG TPA: S8 family serine peptidase [bacterium]|jgi:subtilisin family serine protease